MEKSSKRKIKEIERLKNIDRLLEFTTGDNDFAVRLAALEALSSFKTSSRAKARLLELTKDPDNDVRYWTIESLGNFRGDDVCNVVSPMLKDQDELMRTVAAETLGDCLCKSAISSLRQALSDRSELVRAYASESLGKIGNKRSISVLRAGLRRETRNRARLGFYLGLYRLGEKGYLELILEMLKAKSYRVRCATANTLAELASKNTASMIIETLEKALAKEKTIAAKSSITSALSELHRRFKTKSARRSSR